MNSKKIIYCLLVIFTSFTLHAQNLQNIKVDQLSDDQIKQLVKKAEASGMSQTELESAALAKGMDPSELQKLRDRIQKLNIIQAPTKADVNIDRTRNVNKEENPIDGLATNKDAMEQSFDVIAEKKTLGDKLEKMNFGYYLFNNKNLTFEPSINLPTPANYQLGPGDELIIDIWGASQMNYKQTISPEGKIFIENIGPIYLNGSTIEKASKQIIGKLTTIYSGLQGPNPNTFAQVSLGNLRSIKVSLVGELRTPGTFTLPSLSTVFNALYASGGPGVNGSMREIQLYRESKLISIVDVYDFLLKGDQKSNLRLQDQDIIMVRPYKIKIELSGEVKNPAYFELKENESINDLIKYAGGFTDKAYQYRLKLVRSSDKELKVFDITKDKFDSFKLENGDILTVEPILSRFENRIEISGAVYRPGVYELTTGLTVKRLIEQAEGLRGDAFMTRAILYRQREDFTVEAIPFDLQKLLSGEINDLPLIKEDLIKIHSIFDLREKYDLQIVGEVINPGTFPFMENYTLGDLISTAGGFKEAASLARIDIARRIKDNYAKTKPDKIAEVYSFSISKDLTLSDSAANFKLEPFDRVVVRRSPGYEVQSVITVKGEVNFPGTFSLRTKTEHISDIINRAGGLTKDAYPEGAKLIRKIVFNQEERSKIFSSIMSEASEDNVQITVNNTLYHTIGIDLNEIIKNPYSKYDMIMEEDDQLIVPIEIQTVRMSGALLYPITSRYDNSFSVRDYVSQAGGFLENAKPKKLFVIYANGKVKKTSSILGIKFYPKIKPGAEIVVPKKLEKKNEGMTTAEIIAISTGISSITMAIVAIINLSK